MILKELHIDRSPSYGDRPNQLQGSITFTDNLSEHKIALSPLEINNMIKAIADTVAARAIVSVAAILKLQFRHRKKTSCWLTMARFRCLALLQVMEFHFNPL